MTQAGPRRPAASASYRLGVRTSRSPRSITRTPGAISRPPVVCAPAVRVAKATVIRPRAAKAADLRSMSLMVSPCCRDAYRSRQSQSQTLGEHAVKVESLAAVASSPIFGSDRVRAAAHHLRVTGTLRPRASSPRLRVVARHLPPHQSNTVSCLRMTKQTAMYHRMNSIPLPPVALPERLGQPQISDPRILGRMGLLGHRPVVYARRTTGAVAIFVRASISMRCMAGWLYSPRHAALSWVSLARSVRTSAGIGSPLRGFRQQLVRSR